MKVGVAEYGMNVWDGGLFDRESRLVALREIGYEGVERLEAVSEADALQTAALHRRLGMGFATCRGPQPRASIQWTAALGGEYVWVMVTAKDFEVYCRQVNGQVEACARWGLRVACHNHLGQPVESQEQVEAFLERCPGAGLVFDTAHLGAAGGDCLAIAERYADRVVALHAKDWLVTDPEVGLDRWPKRGRFCELGAGNIGLDNAAVLRALRERGYDGWVFVEHDTHLRDPLEDLRVSREYLRRAGV